MRKIIARKVNMTQIFSETGEVFPVTVVTPVEAKKGQTLSTDSQGLTLESFVEGEIITVSGTSKGKGFQGVVKRHGFKGDSRSHGRKHSERAAGSIGGGGRAGGRVIKGMRMDGRMGGERVTVRNLKVLQVDPAANILLISGAVPG